MTVDPASILPVRTRTELTLERLIDGHLSRGCALAAADDRDDLMDVGCPACCTRRGGRSLAEMQQRWTLRPW
jgi:hypothetical protein